MQDCQDQPLVSPDNRMTFSLSNLMLTGQATPYLHNGVLAVRLVTHLHDGTGGGVQDGHGEGVVGVMERNDVGFLVWDVDEDQTEALNLGSRLKTPVLPIWVTCINSNWGVLFNPKEDLMKSYSAENRFQLYYYSNMDTKEDKETIITIDTRGKDNRRLSIVDSDNEDTEDQTDDLGVAITARWVINSCITNLEKLLERACLVRCSEERNLYSP